jgi:hypothetical protein
MNSNGKRMRNKARIDRSVEVYPVGVFFTDSTPAVGVIFDSIVLSNV